MSIFLHDIPLDEAQKAINHALEEVGLDRVLEKETLPLSEQVLDRVLTEPIWARLSSPHYNASAMDGFAVRSDDTAGASETKPLVLKRGNQFQYVDTGDPVPVWANAVIQIEVVEGLNDQDRLLPDPRRAEQIRIRAGIPPWKNVRTVGEDIIASQLVLPSGRVLGPADLGAVAASGHTHVSVSRKPVVTIIPTGTELIRIGDTIKPGDIIEYNSMVLAGQVMRWGGIALRHSIIADDLPLIRDAVKEAALSSDLVLLNAGSSAGSEDFSAEIVSQLGTLLVHGVAVRPGHPVILGMIHLDNRQVPIIGVPGFPVSAALTGEIFVKPLIERWLGKTGTEAPVIEASITRKITSPAGDDDFLRVVVGKVDGQYKAAPISRGAGVITSLVKADGIAVIPRSIQGLEAGAKVKVRLYRPVNQIDTTILAIGSHDMTLDLLAQHLSRYNRQLVSANVGSQGGLIALHRGEAHLAGSHLLDPNTGEYNLSFIRQYLPDEPVRLVVWAEREQGLMVSKGNPKRIESLSDLARQDITFINRQRGSGTRVLLDYHLKQANLSSTQIRGYLQEEFTHLNVGVAVASGRADCGLGIAAAAGALDLDFIPLFSERYDLVIPCRHLKDGLLDPIFELMKDPEFRTEISQLKGYSFARMGEEILDCSGSV